MEMVMWEFEKLLKSVYSINHISNTEKEEWAVLWFGVFERVCPSNYKKYWLSREADPCSTEIPPPKALPKI